MFKPNTNFVFPTKAKVVSLTREQFVKKCPKCHVNMAQHSKRMVLARIHILLVMPLNGKVRDDLSLNSIACRLFSQFKNMIMFNLMMRKYFFRCNI